MKMMPVAVSLLAFLAAGCAHQVTLEKPQAYSVATQRQASAITAVIDVETLSSKVEIRSFMTGIAHSWEAQPGDMLRQVADIELPQMFARYDFANTYREPPADSIVLELATPAIASRTSRRRSPCRRRRTGPEGNCC
jgi:hypothetical protein